LYELFFNEKYQGFDRETPFDFSRRSSIGCGGKAALAFYPKTVEELAFLARELSMDGIPFYTLGNLTNVLPCEGAIDKAIVCTRKMRLETNESRFFSVGVSATALLALCQRQGLSGAEFLAGIPCTLGGALYMNAGVSGRYIAEIVDSVRVLYRGKITTLSQQDCRFSYKKSVFMDEDCVLLGATLRLVDSTQSQIRENVETYQRRRAHLPKGKSMGCVFKNPKGFSAGALIERTGLKGLRIGGAKISEEHANFIINDKNATAREITSLITMIKNAVYAQYGILLEEEIRYLK